MSINPISTVDLPRWDPWVLIDGENYRLFYLSGHTDQEPWWKTSWICGAISPDMRQWQHTGPLLEPLPDQGWESGRLFAGSAYKEDGVYYLFYSAASDADISTEMIGLATSADGVNWQRSQHPLLSFEDARARVSADGIGYAGQCRWNHHLHWRDPYVIRATDTQQYYLFFCASLVSEGLYQGGLGVAVADALAGPYQLLAPAAGPGLTKEGAAEQSIWPFYHLERPQIIPFQGQYHLFFSCFKAFINPRWLEMIGSDKVTDSTLYWYVSDDITGPFQPQATLPVVPGSESTGLYGTTFLPLSQVGDTPCGDRSQPMKMMVLGWYSKAYKLAVSQEFKAVWTPDELKISLNSVV